MSPLSSEQTERLIHIILSGATAERASALFELLKAVSDPGGDRDRYECAVDAMRATDPLTPEYEIWFQGRIADSSQIHRVPV